MPEAYKELDRIRTNLEKHFKDMQDFEFTIQDGVVYMLQTRNGKRTGVAAVRIACEMVEEKFIDWETAVMRVPADQLDQVLAPIFDRAAVSGAEVIATGLPAGPGAASGKIYFNADHAVLAAEKGEKVLLVRVETSPEDLRGMIAAEGILTARGGVSSHAALVARQMGKVCVCGASDLHIDYEHRTLTVRGRVYNQGEWLSIDGTSGNVYAGQVKTAPSEVVQALVQGDEEALKSRTYRNFAQLMKWCGQAARLDVRTNADTPEQTRNAIAFGAVGIGLTRTEHMFFEGDRIDAMREMILADSLEARKAALAKLLPYQREDFLGIFKALDGYPATIRFLDPPLHEFLPHTKEQQLDLSNKLGIAVEKIMARVHELHEFNPMLGFRGCRLGIKYPEITEMQARAVIEAAAEAKAQGIKAKPEIMIPLVGFKKELDLQIAVVHEVAKAVQSERGVKVDYSVGTMIEIPRGALTADEIAETAQFFSFGTNDLTQTTLGMSRDDSGSFLQPYIEAEIVKKNPFASIDQTGVGQLMQIAIEKGRKSRPDIKLGICGEHGGDPDSVKFCHKIGLNYVSCSPYRVPIARLAAAQAAVKEKMDAKKAGGKAPAAKSASSRAAAAKRPAAKAKAKAVKPAAKSAPKAKAKAASRPAPKAKAKAASKPAPKAKAKAAAKSAPKAKAKPAKAPRRELALA
jgi:pyruvate,orthophosphate dikinase